MLTISETLSAQADAALHKSDGLRSPGRFLVSGMLAGAYIGIGVVLMVATAGPLLTAGSGFAKLVSGLVFGVALTLVVFGGADLLTSAMMILPIGALMRALSPWRAAGVIAATFVANIVGALVFAALIVASGVLHSNAPAGEMLAGMLAAKATEGPLEMFVRGILCNVLVCLAIWMSARVRADIAKIALIFAAILAFISSGFEHVVANMTTYGIGLFSGDPHATWGLFANNVLWVGLGNLVGGAVVVGLGYWIIGGSPRIDRVPVTPATESVVHGVRVD
ncbi:formate/nitrite transporter family protein [Microbacterium dextranolyticum]|uniref:Nitrite transporter NirC n=1 Tax=Microbacterium dextranolyticum TaxID=36806 RepID=A0A9W6HMU7_9MICO|nr:formate/nitrite transporter family protein [Microbacterium dextranolyticum]MBM7463235.1 nitrite transporter NirC [Microbacterium dextranolyticum]GLJ95659.1 nitrite transporter NirC [Microbacterium dextranolyticum]